MKELCKTVYVVIATLFFIGCAAPTSEHETTESYEEVTEDLSEYELDGEMISQFPWPPPRPSSYYKLSSNLFRNCSNLGDMNNVLTSALALGGYSEKSYYSTPNGFALVTRIEQINRNGTSKNGNARWSLRPELYGNFSMAQYLRSVFMSTPGNFRLFVFIVSDIPFRMSSESITESEGIEILNQGVVSLPNELREILVSNDTYCTALVYEFEKPENRDTSYVVIPGLLSGLTHVNRATISQNINNSRCR